MKERFDPKHLKLHRLNRLISILLRIMTPASLLLIFAGLVIYFVTGERIIVEITPLSILLSSLLSFNPAGFITAGLIIMLLMPPAILIISLAHFAIEKESKPLIVCALLLGILLTTYILALK